MGENFDNAIKLSSFWKASTVCQNGVMWKATPQQFADHRLLKTIQLRRSVLKGRYKPRKGTAVNITRPKPRVANAPYYKDKVFQRSLVMNGLYEDFTRDLIWDNVACQTNKGTDLAIRRVVKFLQWHWRNYGTNEGYVEHWDIRKYFPSTPNEVVKNHDRNIVTDSAFLPYLFDVIDLGVDNRPAEEIEADVFGKRGTDLGSMLNQLNQTSLLNNVDHKIKTMVDNYIRFMDDFLVIARTKVELDEARKMATSMLSELGLTLVSKGGVQPIRHGVYFLKIRFILTNTGKVVLKPHPDVAKQERNSLRNLCRLYKRGERSMEDIKTHYQSWIASVTRTDCRDMVVKMDKFYSSLFGEKPIYKIKRRNYRATHDYKTSASRRAS